MFETPLMLAFWSPGPGEMLLILGVALLLYGGKLPEVARSWGQTLSEFRRGLNGIQDEFNQSLYVDTDADRLPYYEDQEGNDQEGDEQHEEAYSEADAEGVVADQASEDKPTPPTA